MKKNSKYYSILNIDLLLVMILYIPIMNFCCAFFTEGDFYGKVISILFFPVCFFLSARLTIIYNNDLRLYYLANRANYKNSLVFLFSQKTFWIKCLLFGGIYLIIPIKWTFGALADVICIKNFLLEKLVCLLIIYPLLFVLAVLANINTFDFWKKNCNYLQDYSNKEYTRQVVMLFLYMSLIYMLICFGIPSAIWVLSKEALETIPTEVVIVLSVALFGLIFLTKYMQQCKRKRFLENVRSVCREKSYSCSQITYTGHSKLVPFSGESFTVTGKTSCKCVLAGGLKKFTLIENTNNGKIRISRDVKLFKIRVFRFSAYYSFNYSQNDKKILIIDKIPKNAYIAEPDNMFSLYEGLTVGDITIFSSSMFLMALKYDEVKELLLF